MNAEKDFFHRLALALGMTIARLKAEMTVDELRDWLAFFSTRPFADEAADHQRGVLTMIIANMFLGKDKKPFELDDFRQINRRRGDSESPPPKMADKFRTRAQKG